MLGHDTAPTLGEECRPQELGRGGARAGGTDHSRWEGGKSEGYGWRRGVALTLVNQTQDCQMATSMYLPLPEGSRNTVATAGAVPSTTTSADRSPTSWHATPSAAARLSATALTLAWGQTPRKASLKSKPRNLGDIDGVFLMTLTAPAVRRSRRSRSTVAPTMAAMATARRTGAGRYAQLRPGLGV